MKKSLLFPHWCQMVGWWILLGWMLWLITVVCHVFEPTHSLPLWIGGVLLILYSFLPSIGTLMVCLSQEKQEDEYIAHIRARSVFVTVIVFFVLLLINVSLTNVGVRMCGWSPSNGYLMFSGVYTNPFIITLFYILIFKGTLFINYLKTRNYAG